MGTNYYLYTNVCPHCNRADEPRHIGKSSAGWCFSLHVYPEDSINSLNHWIPSLENPENVIKDEYGKVIPLKEMLEIITERSGRSRGADEIPYGYESIEEFYRENHAVPGPNNLIRHQIDDRFCVAHGEGPWDCLVGDFS